MSDQLPGEGVRFLNLWAKEFEVGDVWNEGQEVTSVAEVPQKHAYRVEFGNGTVEEAWPALAPRRIGRLTPSPITSEQPEQSDESSTP